MSLSRCTTVLSALAVAALFPLLGWSQAASIEPAPHSPPPATFIGPSAGNKNAAVFARLIKEGDTWRITQWSAESGPHDFKPGEEMLRLEHDLTRYSIHYRGNFDENEQGSGLDTQWFCAAKISAGQHFPKGVYIPCKSAFTKVKAGKSIVANTLGNILMLGMGSGSWRELDPQAVEKAVHQTDFVRLARSEALRLRASRLDSQVMPDDIESLMLGFSPFVPDSELDALRAHLPTAQANLIKHRQQQQRVEYQRITTVSGMEAFLGRYQGDDPGQLIAEARAALPKLRAREAAARKEAEKQQRIAQQAAAERLWPQRPDKIPGTTTCNTRCTNGDCYRVYGDGRKVHFQAPQKFNPFTGQLEWDSGTC